MKKLIVWMVLAALLVTAFAGCGKQEEPTEPEKTTDFEALLRQDAFPPDSTLLNALGHAVEFSDISDHGNSISFTLTAPDISGELLSWYEALDSVTEEKLEQKILELLDTSEKTAHSLQLPYTQSESGKIIFTYSEDYLSAAGCGVRAFYQYLADKVLTGGADNG